MADTLLCAPSAPRHDRRALRERRDAATRDADLVELRLDSLRDPDAPARSPGRRGPVDRHLPPDVGGRRASTAARRSGCAC